MRKIIQGSAVCLTALLPTAFVGHAQIVHDAAKMITEAPAVQSEPSDVGIISGIRSDFQQAHTGAGRPTLAVFWNRQLDDQLSQWYTGSRTISTHNNYWKGEGFTATQERLDVETRFDDRPQPNELAGFEFDSGFTRTLLGTGVSLVDRSAIMRLTHSDAAEVADGIIAADYQQIEIDALKGYADLIAEILFVEGGESELVFLVTIKEVATGQIVTKFRSKPYSFGQRYEEQWVTTANGYEKMSVRVEDPSAPYLRDDIDPETAEYVGWSVALQTMQALTKYWTR